MHPKAIADEEPSNKSLARVTPSKHLLLAQTWLHDSTVPCLRIDKRLSLHAIVTRIARSSNQTVAYSLFVISFSVHRHS